MSRLSVWIRARFGGDALETAEDMLKRLLGEHYEGVWEFSATVVAALEEADTDEDDYVDKLEMATYIIGRLVKRLGIKLPSWTVNWIVEELVRRLKITGDFKIPVPGAQAH